MRVCDLSYQRPASTKDLDSVLLFPSSLIYLRVLPLLRLLKLWAPETAFAISVFGTAFSVASRESHLPQTRQPTWGPSNRQRDGGRWVGANKMRPCIAALSPVPGKAWQGHLLLLISSFGEESVEMKPRGSIQRQARALTPQSGRNLLSSICQAKGTAMAPSAGTQLQYLCGTVVGITLQTLGKSLGAPDSGEETQVSSGRKTLGCGPSERADCLCWEIQKVPQTASSLSSLGQRWGPEKLWH